MFIEVCEISTKGKFLCTSLSKQYFLKILIYFSKFYLSQHNSLQLHFSSNITSKLEQTWT